MAALTPTSRSRVEIYIKQYTDGSCLSVRYYPRTHLASFVYNSADDRCYYLGGELRIKTDRKAIDQLMDDKGHNVTVFPHKIEMKFPGGVDLMLPLSTDGTIKLLDDKLELAKQEIGELKQLLARERTATKRSQLTVVSQLERIAELEDPPLKRQCV